MRNVVLHSQIFLIHHSLNEINKATDFHMYINSSKRIAIFHNNCFIDITSINVQSWKCLKTQKDF